MAQATSSRLTQLALLVFAVFCAVGAVLLGRSISSPPQTTMKRSVDGPEARDWLAQNRHPAPLASNRFSRDDSRRFVESLYDAGSPSVLVAASNIRREDEGDYADALHVRLPVDPAKRKAVLALCGAEAKLQGFSADSDTGQEWVFLWWD